MTDPTLKQIDYLANEIAKLEADMIDPREFGRLEGAVSGLKTELDQVRAKQTQMDLKLDQVLDALSEAKGGWRAMMLLGGAGTTLGAVVSWVLAHKFTIGP